MADKQDNDFLDEEDFDVDPNPPGRKGSILDINPDSLDDISDYDDSEEGIFAPTPEKKKTPMALYGTIAALALAGAGGAYYYFNVLNGQAPAGLSEVIAQPADTQPVEQPTDTAAAVTDTQPAPEQTASAQPADTAASDVAVQPIDDPDLTGLPQPQPISNDPGAMAQQVTAAPVPTETTPAPQAENTAVVPEPTPAPAPVEAPAPDQVAEMPAPPSPSETSETAVSVQPDQKVAVPEPPAPVVETTTATTTPTPMPDVVATPAPAPVTEKVPEVVATPAPQQKGLAIAPKASEPAPAKTDEMEVVPAEQAIAEKTKPVDDYFDAPKGKVLKDFPVPSMNPKRDNGSIIVVNNAKVTSKNQDSRVESAHRAYRLGRYQAAIDMYDELYSVNPRDERILMGRALTLQKLSRTSEAIKAYEEILALNPDNQDAVVNIVGLIRKEYPAVALEKLLSLRDRAPDSPAILAQLGVAYADAGNLEDASTYLKQAVRAEPNKPQHYFNLGVIAERMKDRKAAISYYEKALEVDAVYGNGRGINRDVIYDRLTRLRS